MSSPVICKLLLAAAVAAPAAAEPATAEAPSGVHPLVTSLQTVAREQIAAGTVPGLVLALVEGGARLHVEGFGQADVEAERPMTGSTSINVGSISKAVSAWGFVRYCDREGISLDSPVPPRITSFKLLGSRKFDRSEVTVRRVLSHSAGLSTPSAPVFPATRSLPPLVAVLEGREGGVPRLKLFQTPGRGFAYSGGGYLLLQLMLQEATGESFGRFMAREVLEPVGMASSSFALNAAIRSDAVTFYREDGRRRDLYHLPGAAGGLYSTGEDMARWLTLYAESSGARATLLTEDRFRELLEPQAKMFMGGVDAAGSAYALGHAVWESLAGERYVFHGGGNPGLRAFFFVSPESGNGLFLAANHDRGQEAFRNLIDAWARHYGVQPPPLF